MNILIVEDDPVLRHLLTVTLTGLGHALTTTEGGNVAWAAWEQEHFPVVISDWLMSDLDGLELCRRIRAVGRERYTYFILLTALGGREHYLEGMSAGADDFITKPMDPDTLAARLRVAERVLALQEEVRTLEGLLHICSHCRKICNEGEAWVSLEQYVQEHAPVTYSHGICPDCREIHWEPYLESLRRGNPFKP